MWKAARNLSLRPSSFIEKVAEGKLRIALTLDRIPAEAGDGGCGLNGNETEESESKDAGSNQTVSKSNEVESKCEYDGAFIGYSLMSGDKVVYDVCSLRITEDELRNFVKNGKRIVKLF